jgi:hypothetical protein
MDSRRPCDFHLPPRIPLPQRGQSGGPVYRSRPRAPGSGLDHDSQYDTAGTAQPRRRRSTMRLPVLRRLQRLQLYLDAIMGYSPSSRTSRTRLDCGARLPSAGTRFRPFRSASARRSAAYGHSLSLRRLNRPLTKTYGSTGAVTTEQSHYVTLVIRVGRLRTRSTS